MANRFTDSRKYQGPWFRRLPPKYKLMWDYMTHACNHAGIWKVDFDLASFCIGSQYTYKETVDALAEKLFVISCDKWFIPKFVEFQYGVLNPDNRVHKSVLQILQKEGACKGLIRTIQGRKDYDYDKDKDKESNSFDFKSLWDKYPNKVGVKAAERHFKTSVKTQEDFDNITKALNNYLKSERVGKGFIQNGSTWFNDWQGWISKPVDTGRRMPS